jgi:ABC-type phosphate/phosphonate transport system substrate-binding protein
MKTPRTSPRRANGLPRGAPAIVFLSERNSWERGRPACFLRKTKKMRAGCPRSQWKKAISTAIIRIAGGALPTARAVCGLGLWGAVFVVFAPGAAAQPAATTNPTLVRVGFSTRTIGDANRNDITAAMKVWIQTVAAAEQIAADPHPQVFETVDDMASALQRGEVDAISSAADEFTVLEQAVPLAGLFTAEVGGRITEEYVLLVRQDRAIQSLADLRDDRLVVLEQPRSSLAPAWLDTELLRMKIPSSARFFREIIRANKVSRTILPVFFNQADACLVTRRGFETMGELNPQVLKTLRVLVSSPELVPTIGAYRGEASSSEVDRYRRAVLNLAGTLSGKHILALFQYDAVVEVTESQLSTTRAFLAEHARLKAEAEREAPNL